MPPNKKMVKRGSLRAQKGPRHCPEGSLIHLKQFKSLRLSKKIRPFLIREITYYTCTAIMFAFALKMLWEAWRMGEGELEETQKEVEQELAELDGQAQV